MKYPEKLSNDLKYLAEVYQWTPDDKVEVRAAFTDCEEMVKYFMTLAAAHRAGYKQGAANGHIRLKDWCKEKGLDNPYSLSFDPTKLDLMASQERRLLS